MSTDVSVIVPTYRRPKELTEALASVLQQSDVAIEVIVIDDSPDGTARQIIDGFNDRRIQYIRNPKPTGGIPSVVRNIGWPLAKGDLVHFLDDDDIVPEGHYSNAMRIMSRSRVGMMFGRIDPFGSCPVDQLVHERQYFLEAARSSLRAQRFGSRWGFVASMLFRDALLVSSASIIRRECVLATGGFDPAIRLMEDSDFHLRVMREFGVCFIDETTVRYRIGSPSLMHDPSPDPLQLERQIAGRRLMQSKYRVKRGLPEFCILAMFAKGLLASGGTNQYPSS
jgi:glycosyltransferase involved in cell wall biosynthesis